MRRWRRCTPPPGPPWPPADRPAPVSPEGAPSSWLVLWLVLWVVPWSLALSVVDVRTRRLPTPMVWCFTAGVVVGALVDGPPAIVRAAMGATVLAGVLGLAGRSTRATEPGIGGGDVRLGVPLGAWVGWSGPSTWDALVDPLLVAGGASLLALGAVGLRAVMVDEGERRRVWREPLAFGPWLCVAAVVIGFPG